MIPKNIKMEHVIKAIQKIDSNGYPDSAKPKKYYIEFDGKFYPAKHTLALSNVFANYYLLDHTKFGGGDQTNDFLTKLGFKIVE
ncbi:hypothetical protein ES707_20502 [subsurface metagenome]